MDSIKQSFGRLRTINPWEVGLFVAAVVIGAVCWYRNGQIGNECLFVIASMLALSLGLAIYRALSFIIGVAVMLRNLIDFFADRVK